MRGLEMQNGSQPRMPMSSAAQPWAVSHGATIPPDCPLRRSDDRSIVRFRQPSRHPPAPTEAVVVRVALMPQRQDQVDPCSASRCNASALKTGACQCLQSRLCYPTHNTEVQCGCW